MAYNTIKLKKFLDVVEEIQASGTIRPGMLLELDSSGYVKAHSSAGQNAIPMFAVEDEGQGNDIDDNYSSGDKVRVWFPQRGAQVYAILADGENIDEGDYLESNGEGYLQKHAADTESFESAEPGAITVYPLQIVAQAIEAKDLSGSSGEESSDKPLAYERRIKVRIV
jgi:hypothetical protein